MGVQDKALTLSPAFVTPTVQYVPVLSVTCFFKFMLSPLSSFDLSEICFKNLFIIIET